MSTLTTSIEQIKRSGAAAAFNALRSEVQMGGGADWSDDAAMIVSAVRQHGAGESKQIATASLRPQNATEKMRWAIAHAFEAIADSDFAAFCADMNEPVDSIMSELELVHKVEIDMDETDEEFFIRMFMTPVGEFYARDCKRSEQDIEVLSQDELISIGTGHWNKQNREKAARIIRSKGIAITA